MTCSEQSLHGKLARCIQDLLARRLDHAACIEGGGCLKGFRRSHSAHNGPGTDDDVRNIHAFGLGVKLHRARPDEKLQGFDY